jgi:NADPH2:quinone reductase
LVLPAGTSAADAAGAFVNPLTALGMVETMKLEGHSALVHNPAASSLGQMLVRLCLADGVPLVNIVRKPEQVALLKDLGAKHVVNSSSATFTADLFDAVDQTGATLAFDAAGGGTIAGHILTAMELMLNRSATDFSRYGNSTHKQVYIYGGLDTGPTEIRRNFGMSWGIGGWLVFPFTQRIGTAATQKLKQRIASELTGIFATSYSKMVTLAHMLQPSEIAVYGQRSTGGKYLVVPHG